MASATVSWMKISTPSYRGSYLVPQPGFLFPQKVNCFSKAHIPSPGLNYEEASHDHKEDSRNEIEDAAEEFDDHKADGRKSKARLHIRVHSPLS